MSAQGTPGPGAKDGDPVQKCPLAKHVIEVLVVDDYDTPVDAVVVRLAWTGGQTLTRTGPDGLVRFEGLAQVPYQVALPEIDKDAWRQPESTELHPELKEGDAT